MKKSTLAFFLFIAIVIGSVWYYLADKFEKIAIEEIIPKIQESEYIHVSDANLIKIDKFKFAIELGNVQILENDNLVSLKIDIAKVFYNPFTDHLILHFGGDRLSLKLIDKEFYAAKPNNYIEFNRSLLNKDFNKCEVIYSFGETKFFNAATNQEISTFKEVDLNLAFEKTADTYNSVLKIDFKGFKRSIDELKGPENPICMLINNLAKNSHENAAFEDCLGLQERIVKLYQEERDAYGLGSGHVSMSSSVPINLVEAIWGNSSGEEIIQILKDSQIKFGLVTEGHNSFSKTKLSYSLNKENGLVNTSTSNLLRYDLADEPKNKLCKGIASVFIDALDKLGKKDHGFNQEKLANLIAKLLDIDIMMDANLEVDFSNPSDIVAKAQLDSKFGEKQVFVASITNINGKDGLFKFSFEAEKLDQLIDYVLTYFGELISIEAKISDSQGFQRSPAFNSENHTKVKEGLFELMQLIHNEPGYKLGNPFKFELEFKSELGNLTNIRDIKINNKTYEEYAGKLLQILGKMGIFEEGRK